MGTRGDNFQGSPHPNLQGYMYPYPTFPNGSFSPSQWLPSAPAYWYPSPPPPQQQQMGPCSATVPEEKKEMLPLPMNPPMPWYLKSPKQFDATRPNIPSNGPYSAIMAKGAPVRRPQALAEKHYAKLLLEEDVKKTKLILLNEKAKENGAEFATMPKDKLGPIEASLEILDLERMDAMIEYEMVKEERKRVERLLFP